MTKRKYTKSVDGRDVRAYLSDTDISKAALLGGGNNVSKGIRIALAAHYASVFPDNDGDDTPDDDLGPNPDPGPVPAPAPAPQPAPKPASPRPSPGFLSVAEMERRMSQAAAEGFEPISSEGLTAEDLAEMRRNTRDGEPITEADYNAGRVRVLPPSR